MIQKFSEYEKINEDIEQFNVIFRSELYTLAFDIFENAKTKEDVYNIINKNLKQIDENVIKRREAMSKLPPNAYM